MIEKKITRFWGQYVLPVDIDGDGIVEVIVVAQREAFICRLDGTILPGWPQPFRTTSYAPPMAADLDGDKRMEIIVGEYGEQLHIWTLDGRPFCGSPLQLSERVWSAFDVMRTNDPGEIALVGRDTYTCYQFRYKTPYFAPQRVSMHGRIMRQSPWYFAAPTGLTVTRNAPGSVTLRWRRNLEPYLTGYRISWARWRDVMNNPAPDGRHDPYTGTSDQGSSGITIKRRDLADDANPSYTLTGLELNTTYVFTVNGTSPWIQESPFAKEVFLNSSRDRLPVGALGGYLGSDVGAAGGGADLYLYAPNQATHVRLMFGGNDTGLSFRSEVDGGWRWSMDLPAGTTPGQYLLSATGTALSGETRSVWPMLVVGR